jgi:phospholipase C
VSHEARIVRAMAKRHVRSLLALPLLLAPLAAEACGGDDTSPAASGDAGADHTTPPAADAAGTDSAPGNDATPPDAAGDGGTSLASIQQFVVIYLENHSFDNLYGEFPGADGITALDAAAPNVAQVDEAGVPFATLPMPTLADGGPDPRFPPSGMKNAPFAIEDYIPADAAPPDLHHIFFTEQNQINAGAMNKFALWSDARGFSMGHYHTTNLPLADVAKGYTLCDAFFHAAFGGSFLNHHWLIAARTPEAPAGVDAGIDDPSKLTFGAGEGPYEFDTADQKWYAVNTAFSGNAPHPYFAVTTPLVPDQTSPTIGDRLTDKSIDWAWYAGGWDDAMAYSADGGVPDGGVTPILEKFQYHHQPFVYYAKYAEGQPGRAHLKDEKQFLAAAQAGTLPPVSFVKPVGVSNEHPGYTDILEGEVHVAALIDAVKKSPQWPTTAIIVTYDEHGGFWDHVTPPKTDKWGPGSRVPAIVISPLAKKGFVDHTVYDTTSILATIEKRFALAPLTARDTAAKDMSAAFDFKP